MHILSVLFLPGSAEADFGWGRKLNDHLVASCIMNMCTKKLWKLDNPCSSYGKLEIWGKAQCESARRPKPDWRENLGGGWNSPGSHAAHTQTHLYKENVHCWFRVGKH